MKNNTFSLEIVKKMNLGANVMVPSLEIYFNRSEPVFAPIDNPESQLSIGAKTSSGEALTAP